MKKYLKIILAITVVGIAFASCSKKVDYDTFDTTKFQEANRPFAYLKNSLNTQNQVVINAIMSGSSIAQLSNESVKIYLNTTHPASSTVSTSLKVNSELVSDYSQAKETDYVVLPNGAYTLSGENLSVASGSMASNDGATVTIDKSQLQPGNQYLLPIQMSDTQGQESSTNEDVVYIVVNVPEANAATAAKPGDYRQILYVEVNDHNPLNAGNYFLSNSKIPFFDVVNIFAANVNYDEIRQKTFVYFNPQVNAILTNREKYIVPLQKKGIKVCLALLGNHQGVGLDNFTSHESIDDFAQQVKTIVDDYQLDGVDLDDEYSGYGSNGQPGVNDSSLVLLVKRLREVMPDKIISYYYFSDAVSIPRYAQWNGLTVGQYIDYTYQGVYGRYSVPNMPGLNDGMKIGPYSVNLANNQRVNTLNSQANTVKNNGYGIFMWYNLAEADRSSWFDTVSDVFYGEGVDFEGEPYERDF